VAEQIESEEMLLGRRQPAGEEVAVHEVQQQPADDLDHRMRALGEDADDEHLVDALFPHGGAITTQSWKRGSGNTTLLARGSGRTATNPRARRTAAFAAFRALDSSGGESYLRFIPFYRFPAAHSCARRFFV